jgi:ribosomal protein S18 acetylase RimI-like enzyme
MNPPSPKPEDLLLHQADPGEATSIATLIRQLAEDIGETSPVTEAYARQYLLGKDQTVLLAEFKGQVVGLLSYSVRRDLYHAGETALIEELVVDREYRGQGIGSALMDLLLERLQGLGCKEVSVTTLPGNERAICFYKKHRLTDRAVLLERHF